MDTSLGNERTATLPGRYRTACTIAAMVVMAAFAKDALPAFGWTMPATTIKHEAPPVQTPVAPAPRLKTITRIKSGLASWYGKMLQGRPTASGRPFDMNELTAAHRTLPFGSKVKVTDLRNKRSVVVTITDRGPVPDDRVIDLSLGAARELRMVGTGVAPVRLELFAFQN
jgi:rare lipoprotein A